MRRQWLRCPLRPDALGPTTQVSRMARGGATRQSEIRRRRRGQRCMLPHWWAGCAAMTSDWCTAPPHWPARRLRLSPLWVSRARLARGAALTRPSCPGSPYRPQSPSTQSWDRCAANAPAGRRPSRKRRAGNAGVEESPLIAATRSAASAISWPWRASEHAVGKGRAHATWGTLSRCG